MIRLLVLAAIASASASLLLRWLAPFIVSRTVRRFFARRAIPVLEAIALIAGPLAAILTLFAELAPESRTAVALLVAVAVWSLRSLIEDLVASLLVRMEGTVEVGHWIRARGVAEGRVLRVGYRSAVVESATGDTVRVPLRELANRSVVVVRGATAARAHTFTLDVPKTRPLAPVLNEIPAMILTSPWASITRPPDVALRAETESHYRIDVTAYSIDPAFASDIESFVRRAITGG